MVGLSMRSFAETFGYTIDDESLRGTVCGRGPAPFLYTTSGHGYRVHTMPADFDSSEPRRQVGIWFEPFVALSLQEPAYSNIVLGNRLRGEPASWSHGCEEVPRVNKDCRQPQGGAGVSWSVVGF
jgi:hypothetical protein